ncbi:MAG: M20/M25/M40 family metallo-hydrolase [Aeoliella sp.]
MRYFHFSIIASLLAVLWSVTCSRAEDATSIEHRLTRTIHLLASDQMAGRGLGTPEIDQAAEFIRQQFSDLGLATDSVDGSAFQPFDYTMKASIGGENSATFAKSKSELSHNLPLILNRDYRPLAIGGAGPLNMPLVFIGYGITAPEANYDDYASIDVSGKAVIVLRHEPRQSDANSPFNGTDHSAHAPFRRKVKNAIDHGAKAILFCTDQFEIDKRIGEWRRRQRVAEEELAKAQTSFQAIGNPTQKKINEHDLEVKRLSEKIAACDRRADEAFDPLLAFEGAGRSNDERRIPVLACSRGTINRLLIAAGQPLLQTLEQQIDERLSPASRELDDWHLQGAVDIERKIVEIKNVIGILEGEGPLADETIIIGAHYDHLGRVAQGSTKPEEGAIHNGADDNASGTAALLEVARYFAMKPINPARRLVFIAFTGEERGLLGSAHYVKHPLFPLETTVAMFNFDMVGRLANNKLNVNGYDSAQEFSQLVDQVNERHGFELGKVPGGHGRSDHASFSSRKIPSLHFFTGFHDEYHRPSDDVELLNVPGLRRVSEYACELVELVVASPDRPKYVAPAPR